MITEEHQEQGKQNFELEEKENSRRKKSLSPMKKNNAKREDPMKKRRVALCEKK